MRGKGGERPPSWPAWGRAQEEGALAAQRFCPEQRAVRSDPELLGGARAGRGLGLLWMRAGDWELVAERPAEPSRFRAREAAGKGR